jgi:hypothetical protein
MLFSFFSCCLSTKISHFLSHFCIKNSEIVYFCQVRVSGSKLKIGFKCKSDKLLSKNGWGDSSISTIEIAARSRNPPFFVVVEVVFCWNSFLFSTLRNWLVVE